MTEQIPLKPCPFCGGGVHPFANLRDDEESGEIVPDWTIIHKCSVVGEILCVGSTEEFCIAAWNTRKEKIMPDQKKCYLCEKEIIEKPAAWEYKLLCEKGGPITVCYDCYEQALEDEA